MKARLGVGVLAFAALYLNAGHAQEPPPVDVDRAPLDEPVAGDASVDQVAPAITEGVASEINTDEMASQLNASQRIQQTFTFTRTINGEVVDTESKTVTYSPNDPVRPSEAGGSVLDELSRSFNNELLTRSEAFEEAKLDFVVADIDRDGFVNEAEFVRLVETWREKAERDGPPSQGETARDRQYRAFIDEINPNAAIERARGKFSFMTGASQRLSRADYIREYLLDFDSMDGNDDSLLRGEELAMFRTLNKGETLAR